MVAIDGNGPKETLTTASYAAAQLHQSSLSCIAQPFSKNGMTAEQKRSLKQNQQRSRKADYQAAT
jgi:hypothetical protein